jgi:thiamine kinase-like enzyme
MRCFWAVGAIALGLSAADTCEGEALESIVSSALPGTTMIKGSEKSIKGGITNLLWKVQLEKDGEAPFPALLRCYGQNTDLLIDRKVRAVRNQLNFPSHALLQKETEVLVGLSDLGFDVALHGAFPNGRIEKWLSGKALDTPQIRDPVISDAIATQLALLHTKTPQLPSFPGVHAGESELQPTLHKWVKLAREAALDLKAGTAATPVTAQNTIDLVALDIERVAETVEALQSNLADFHARPGPHGPLDIVFGHADLLASNIIMDPANPKSTASHPFVTIIDFE